MQELLADKFLNKISELICVERLLIVQIGENIFAHSEPMPEPLREYENKLIDITGYRGSVFIFFSMETNSTIIRKLTPETVQEFISDLVMQNIIAYNSLKYETRRLVVGAVSQSNVISFRFLE